MKLPRNARIFQGQLDVAPFASVFFLLLMFVLLASRLYTPGVQVHLPEADEELAGTDQPSIAVAVARDGRLYFENQEIGKDALQNRLREAAARSREPLTLVVQADKDVTEENLVSLALMAGKAGIHDLLFATLPRVFIRPNPVNGPGPP
jgi:biopolymer transport protein ExbD